MLHLQKVSTLTIQQGSDEISAVEHIIFAELEKMPFAGQKTMQRVEIVHWVGHSK
jgi:hypothetical protein